MKILFTLSLFLVILLLLPISAKAQSQDCDFISGNVNTAVRWPQPDLRTVLAIDDFVYQPGNDINICVSAANWGIFPINFQWNVTLSVRQIDNLIYQVNPWPIHSVTLQTWGDYERHEHVLTNISLPFGVYELRAVFADFPAYFMSVFLIIDPPVPVELTAFSAQLDGQAVILNWQTATEVNNYGFELERSIDEKNYQLITFIPGNGNSNSPKFYSYRDTRLSGGNTFYYRLKQIDNDGTYEYVATASVELELNDFSLAQNYPNPFNPSTNIVISPILVRLVLKYIMFWV